MQEIEKIKGLLLAKYSTPHQIELVNASILYVQKKIGEKDKYSENPKYNFAADFLLQSIAECIDNGFGLDGVNYVITGNRMYMPSYKAFKNKLYMVYPDTVIDLQVIRDGDTYNFAKEGGSVIYSHGIGDPFETKEREIIGAYCVIKNSRGEFLETLNKTDFEKMRMGSKSPDLWLKWLSEFWLKSVIKRACKRHFNDITNALEEKDNEVVGLADVVKAPSAKKQAIIEAKKKATSDGNNNT